MILTKRVTLKRRGNNKLSYYKELGYDIYSDFFLINIEHLSNGSSLLVEVKCDTCKIVNELSYKDYNRFNNYPFYICPNCKREKTNLEKYGVDYVSKLETSKEKAKLTCLNKYGVDHPLKSEKIKEKIKETNLKKWGVENIFQSEEIKNKIKDNNLKNWNVGYYSQTGEFLDKYISTSLENWGVDHPLKSDIIKEKTKETNLRIWGFNIPSKSQVVKDRTRKTFNKKWGGFTLTSDILKEKVKETNLERYGVDHYSKTKDYLKKVKETNLERYGVDHLTKDIEYRKNFIITNDKNYIKYLSNNKSLFKCDRGHEFIINSSNFSDRKRYNIPLCTVFNPIGDSQSIKEKELFLFISSVYNGEIIQSYRDGLEIDIYIPDLKIGFEFNGLYYHSELYKDKNYHLNKNEYFKERGIRIIHIWEDDWDFKNNIIKSQIMNLLGLTENRIYARKCEVREIKDSKITVKFLNENHIQGRVNSSLKLGLYYKNELVGLMTFDHYEGRKKMEEGGWNINRFCNKLNYNVIGGAGKLFKHFINNHEVKRVISYADKDWSKGGLYVILGFTKIQENNPDYKYILNSKRVHKSRFRKSKTNMTESKLEIPKIWDCGKIKFEKQFK